MLDHKDLTNLPDNFKEYLEAKAVSERQMVVIQEYQAKIFDYEQKIHQLEQLLHAVAPTIGPSDEELVAKSQLLLFKQRISDGVTELTLDETRKFEIYTKILNQIDSRKKPSKPKDVTPIEDLLMLAEETNGSPAT